MLSTVALALALGAPALKDAPKPGSPIIGEWVLEKLTIGGHPVPPDNDLNRWVFGADGTRAIYGTDGKQVVKGKYTAAAEAGTIDLDPISPIGPVTGPYLCRFKVDGDTLTLNLGWPSADRPPGLESPPNSRCTLFVMKRVKPKD